METLMRGIADALSRLGVAVHAGRDYVSVGGMEFYAERRGRKSFRFCGRTYITGNVVRAAVDLLQELPVRVRQAEEEQARRARYAEERALRMRNYELAKELTSRFSSLGMTIEWTGSAFRLTYECHDAADLRTVAEKVAHEMEAAAESAWQSLLSEAAEVPTTVKFTAEGGFSLN